MSQEPIITYQDFTRVDMRVGRILRAEPFPKARKPAYKLWIDFGELGERKTSAQITDFYTLEELPGRLVVGVVNFEAKQIADFRSEVLVMGVDGERDGVKGVILLQPQGDAEPGQRVY